MVVRVRFEAWLINLLVLKEILISSTLQRSHTLQKYIFKHHSYLKKIFVKLLFLHTFLPLLARMNYYPPNVKDVYYYYYFFRLKELLQHSRIWDL